MINLIKLQIYVFKEKRFTTSKPKGEVIKQYVDLGTYTLFVEDIIRTPFLRSVGT